VATDCRVADAEGDQYELAALICDFGGEKGMAILPAWDESVAEHAASQGFGVTVLGASYEIYDRPLFEDTLNDWQWCGADQPPPRYTGVPWSE
jgi:hypothetical protein